MWRLVLLAIAAFIAQTNEYLPISVMPAIRDNIAVSESAIGSLVTGYAWIAALTAAPFTMLSLKWDRKALFLTLMGSIALAGLLGATAPGFAILALSRLLMALAHGVFWAILAVLAIRLAPDMPRTKVLAVVFSGISLAGVAGIPLSTFIGHAIGWRWAFAIFSLAAMAIAVTAMPVLPKIPRGRDGTREARSLNNHSLRTVVVATATIMTGHFCSYTYIVPLLERSVGGDGFVIPLLLFAFGAAGAVGTVLAGGLHVPSSCLALISTAGIVVGQWSFMIVERPFFLGLLLALWGASTAALVIGLQGMAIQSAPDNADMASAFYVTAFNIGIGGGALMGGAILAVAPHMALLWTGGAFAIIGLMIIVKSRS